LDPNAFAHQLSNSACNYGGDNSSIETYVHQFYSFDQDMSSTNATGLVGFEVTIDEIAEILDICHVSLEQFELLA